MLQTLWLMFLCSNFFCSGFYARLLAGCVGVFAALAGRHTVVEGASEFV